MPEENTGIKETKLPAVVKIFFGAVILFGLIFIVEGLMNQRNVDLNLGSSDLPAQNIDQNVVTEDSFTRTGTKVKDDEPPKQTKKLDDFKEERNLAQKPLNEKSPYQKYVEAEQLRVRASYRSKYESSYKSKNTYGQKPQKKPNRVTSELDRLSKSINSQISLLQGSISSEPQTVGQSDRLSKSKKEDVGPKPGQVLISPGSIIEIRPDIKTISSLSGSMWRGMVTRDVYDHEKNFVVIPKGSNVFGTNEGITGNTNTADVGLALVAQSIYLPNNKKINISIPGMGTDGGFIGSDVKHHTLRKISGFVAYALIGNGLALDTSTGENQFSSQEQNLQTITRDIKSIADQKAADYLNIKPTVYIKPGEVVNLLITDNIWSEPYSAIDQTQYVGYK